MSVEVITQLVVQVPALALVIWFSARIVDRMLDRMAEKLDKLTSAIERHTEAHR